MQTTERERERERYVGVIEEHSTFITVANSYVSSTIRENRQLVTDEPVKFKTAGKWLIILEEITEYSTEEVNNNWASLYDEHHSIR